MMKPTSITLLLLIILTGIGFCDDYWVYVQTEDQWDKDIASSAQKGDMVDILPVCPQFTPTNTESSHWAIVMVDLDPEDVILYKEMMYEAANPEPTPTETPLVFWLIGLFSPGNLYAQEIDDLVCIAYRKYKIDDLVSLGLDTKGKKEGKKEKTKFKSKVKKKKKSDITKWKEDKEKWKKEKDK